jgi:tetratricopeptide (TPR) repeat protein
VTLRRDAASASAYTLRRVQAMLGLSRHVIAGLIAQGFVEPGRGPGNAYRFSFQDLMLLRTAHALRSARIPPRRIFAALAKLKATLPAELPLTGLRITAIGADVAVRSPQGRWQADSGQLLMDFDVAPLASAGSVAIIERGHDRDADAWFERGQALEATDADAAEAAYRQALALAPAHVDAAVNLGALWSEAGRYAEVVALCNAAAARGVQAALIDFNRGVALDHLEKLSDAAASYEASLALDPALADAHYNLARVREQLGDARGALRHYNAYRRLQSRR